jgi:CheY-like chemotaxis protein
VRERYKAAMGSHDLLGRGSCSGALRFGDDVMSEDRDPRRRRPPLKSTESVMLRLPTRGEPAPMSSSQRRMLIIDDNEDMRRTLLAHFRTEGWDVDVAHDVRTAIESALVFQPQVILSELLLPDARGYHFARTLRSIIDHDIRIVGITRQSQHVFEQARVAGFDVVFAKPIDVDQLHRLLELP